MRLLELALAIALAAAAPPISLFLAGDSTMAPKREDRRPETGWGERLQSHFDSSRVVVRNHAVNGRSTRSFIAEGRWSALVDSLRPGDHVFVQFGHNDESPEKQDRYSPPPAFRANLERFIADVRAKGATPVLLTPVVRRRFDASGTLADTHGEYDDLVREVAAATRVVLIDAERETRALVASYGPDSSRLLFLHLAPAAHPNYPDGVADDTHFSARGASEVAALVVRAIRRSRLGLAAHLVEPRIRTEKR